MFGIAAFIFVEILWIGKWLSNLTKTSAVLTGMIGGLSLVAIAVLFSDDYLGLGWTTVSQSLKGDDIPWYAFVLKAITTSVTLNFGGRACQAAFEATCHAPGIRLFGLSPRSPKLNGHVERV